MISGEALVYLVLRLPWRPLAAGRLQMSGKLLGLCPGSAEDLQGSVKMILSARLHFLCKFLELRTEKTSVLRQESCVTCWVPVLVWVPCKRDSETKTWIQVVDMGRGPREIYRGDREVRQEKVNELQCLLGANGHL
jgi:hypothetical protein